MMMMLKSADNWVPAVQLSVQEPALLQQADPQLFALAWDQQSIQQPTHIKVNKIIIFLIEDFMIWHIFEL